MLKRAILLAGGRGTRLRPYTVVLPKPLMPIGDYPILEVIVRQLVKHGFTHITMAVNHQADLIKSYFGSGEKWRVFIDYSLEEQPLGTMGPLRLIDDLPDDFLVMNGDVLTDLNFSDFYEKHINSQCSFSISAHTREQNIDYGVLSVNEHSILTGFSEKPKERYRVSMGVYMVNKKVIRFVRGKELYGFDSLMGDMLRNKEKVKVIEHLGYWLDIGRPDDYMEAIDRFESNMVDFLNA